METQLCKWRLEDVASIETDKELWLEIGFGGGEHLAGQAKKNPDVRFIGCEPFENGVASLLGHVAREGLENVRIYKGDARRLLKEIHRPLFSRAFILFPDPWPKQRQHRRRLINGEMLALLSRVMKPGGKLLIATDELSYRDWIDRTASKAEGFEYQPFGTVSPPDWIPTRYQEKAREQGRIAHFMTLIRRTA